LSNTYENLKEAKRSSPEGAETADDNVYDVAEFVEKDSIQERKAEIVHLATLEQETSSQNDLKSSLNANIEPVADNIASDETQHCLIENEGEKTIIFSSAAIASSQSKHHLQNNENFQHETNNRQSSNKSEHQILISSSSWIDLQGESNENSCNRNILQSEEKNRNCDSPSFGSLPIVSCKLGGSLPSDVCKLEVAGSISIGGRPHASEWAVSADPGITLDSLEPVKPPRLKKIARMQQQQQQQQLQNIHYQQQQQQQHQNDLLRHVMHREQFKMSNRSVPHHHHHQRNVHQQQQQQQRNSYSPRPDISAPILLATTLNPNDADGHR
jgi:hypothetical protein